MATHFDHWRRLAAVDLSAPEGLDDALRLVEELHTEEADDSTEADAAQPDPRDEGLQVVLALLDRDLAADDRALVSDFCSETLLERYRQRHTASDRDQALAIRRAQAASAGSPWACAAQVNLAGLLMTPWDRTADEEEEHLEEARTALTAATGHAGTPAQHAIIAGARGNLHSRLYDLHRSAEDLHQAIDAYTIATTAEDPAVAAKGRASLASSYLERFRTASGAITDLAEAEQLARSALADPAVPPTTWRYELLVRIMRERCAQDGDEDRLAEAWELTTALLEAVGEDPVARASLVGTAAALAHLRHLAHHDRAALDEAIDLTEEALGALDTAPGSHRADEDRAVLANEACLLLTERFTLDGARRDIDRAVEVALRCLDLPVPLSIGLGLRTNLANALYRRYESYHRNGDLQRGIALMRWVTHRSAQAPEKADALNSLALLLGEKARGTKRDADFLDALARIDEAIDLTPASSSDRAGSLINKVTVLSDRAHNRPEHRPSLDELIAMLDEAWQQAPARSAVRARAAYLLAGRHAERAGLHAGFALPDTATPQAPLTAAGAADLRQAFQRWNEAVSLEEPFVTIEAGQQLGNASFALEQWPTAALGYRAALKAADELTARRSLDADRQLARMQVQGVAAAAALAELRTGSAREAVLRLEEGTATLLARSLGQRTHASGYDDIVAAAQTLDGPLVYWAATLAGGFAIVVRPDGKTMPCPLAVTGAQIESRLADLRAVFTRRQGTADTALAHFDTAVRELLSWTWQNLMAPVADLLDDYATVGLIPVGRLASLPLAAAATSSAIPLLSRTLPRHLPSSRALRPPAPWPPAPGVLVGCDPGQGERRLPHAEAEADLVAGCYTRAQRLSIPRPAPPTAAGRVLRTRGTAPAAGTTAGAAGSARAFDGADVVHVICHYDLHPEQPLDSVLRFGDGVRVADLMDQRLLGTPHLVLSACDTGLGGISLPDEALGLGTALLAAGARSVVASLWPLDDELAAPFMEAYHRRLAAGTEPAQALAEVQREAAGEQPAVVWPGLVHLG
ncbi:CHAT domain-containing protein [Streptomyces sp. NPDC047070]|uniref:CHAT domain-containing protein n=1 Tax=Streptomyces sp. NPDC047070 TaxID=3154923 RepID=UPI00345496CB